MGRPLKLNRVVLQPDKLGRVYIIPLGDMHIGYPTTNYKKIRGYIDYCLKNHCYVIGIGDYLECGQTNSVGNSAYKQTLNPQKQLDNFVEMFKPLAKAGLLLGLHQGNHEERIMNNSGLDVTKIACDLLGVRNFGYAMYHLIKVGKQNYTAFSCHGASGARMPYTKIKSVIDLARFVSVEIIMMGHVHEVMASKFTYYTIDIGRRQKVKKDKHVILTGHFLEYEGSYAEMKNMSPSKTGAVKIVLSANKHDIHTSQ